MAVTKLGLYNDALTLLGQRVLATDTENREPRFYLDNLYNNGGVDYCLEIVKPRYATKVISLNGSAPTAVTGFAFQIDLPDADFAALVDVYADGKLEQPITKFYREGDYILCDFSSVFVRYIQDFASSGLTNMPHSFGRVVSAYFARELAVKIDADSYEDINKELEKRIEVIAKIEGANEPGSQGLLPLVLTEPWRKIFNDALLILGLDPIATGSDDSVRKNRLSIALDAGLVASVLEDNAWGFGSETAQVFFDSAINPDWGYTFACKKPATLHRLDGVYADEFFNNPIREYADESGFIYSSYQVIYLEYISTVFLTDPNIWPAYFKRMIAARMALDAGPSIEGANVDNAATQYDTRRREAKSTDAIQQPPRELTQGSWSRTRRELHQGRRDRP